jgi:hypothetical protein
MLLIFPALVVPMLALAFYGLGGGKGGFDGKTDSQVHSGLNMTLPLAHFDSKGKPMDKLGFYEKAALDSARLRERRKGDPYSTGKGGFSGTKAPDTLWRGRTAVEQAGHPPGRPDTLSLPGTTDLQSGDAQADLVLRKLGDLKEALNRSRTSFETGKGEARENPGTGYEHNGPRSPKDPLEADSASLGRGLREAMAGLAAAGSSKADPEMDRIDGMLDKLIRIQHPEAVKQDSVAGPVVARATRVVRAEQDDRVNTLDAGDHAGFEAVGFIEIGERDNPDSVQEMAIAAVINSDQTLTSGSTVALRLGEEAVVAGHRLPKNQLIYGMASLSGERLLVNISSVRVGQSIFPVALQVYDLDGLIGVRAQGAISRDVSKQSADQAMSGLELASLDPSLGAQAASAGLEFAKSLASRKVRLVRVVLPAGYKVFLKNSKSVTH